MSNTPLPEQTQGGQTYSVVSDNTVQELLLKILVELQKLNVHLASMTDMVVTDEDVEGDES